MCELICLLTGDKSTTSEGGQSADYAIVLTRFDVNSKDIM